MVLFFTLVVTVLGGAFLAGDVMHTVIVHNAVAVLSFSLHHGIAAFTEETALHAKHLRTRHDQNGQRGEDAFAEKGHVQL